MSKKADSAADTARPATPRPAPAVQARPCSDPECVGNLQMAASHGTTTSRSGDAQSNQAMQRTGDIHAAAQRGISGAGTSLPYLDQIQRSFGRHDVQHVQAHTGSQAQEAAGAMGADAFTFGDHVAFGGAPDLSTAAHEAAHVVQQRAGVHLAGGVGKAGDVYEQHADRVAALVVQGQSSEAVLDEHAGGGSHGIQRQCAKCAVGEPCECGAVQKEETPGFIPEPANDKTEKKVETAEAKTFANGWTFSSNRAFTRDQLVAMWKATDRKTMIDFVDNCDADDAEAKSFNEQMDLPWKGWHPGNMTPPPAPGQKPVVDKPPPTPAEVEKSGLMKRLKIYEAIRWEFRKLDAERGAFTDQFQASAKAHLEMILEASKRNVEAEQARYGLDAEGKKSGKSNTADVQKDLAEMAQHAARLAQLKRALNKELAAETAAASPGGVSLAFGLGSGPKAPTMNGTSGIGPRMRVQQPYDEERAYALRRWPALAGFDPKNPGQDPTEWENLAAGATKTKPGPDQLGMIQSDIETKLENIQTVKDHIGNGELIWTLPVIIGGTKTVMNVGKGSIEDKWVEDHETQLKEDKETHEKIMFAITMALVVITLVPSGGSSAIVLAGGAASVGLAGMSSYEALQQYQAYTLQSAESNTTYDQALAISFEEPSLFKVAWAALAAGLDIWGATHAFRAVRGLYRAALLKEAGAAEKMAARANELKPGLGQELLEQVAKGRDAAGDLIKTREAMAADKIGDMMHVAGGHEGCFSTLGKLFRCSPLCAEARYLYEGILASRPDLLAELNRLESGVLDMAEVAARKPAANALLNRLETIKQIQSLSDAELRELLQATKKVSLSKELEREAVQRFGSLDNALKPGPEILGKAAEAPAMKAVDPGAWMAPENFKAFDAVNPNFGKGAKFSSTLVEETSKGRKIWVVEQRISGGKWYSIKTLNAAEATEPLVRANVEEALKKAFDEAVNKAASLRDPIPVYGKDVYLRVIKDGPAEAIEIVIQIPLKNSRDAAAEIAKAQAWAETARKGWASIGDLPPTTVVVRAKP